MIRLAFSNLACPDWSLPEVVAAAQRFGYEGVELRLIGGEVIDPAALSADERASIARLFAEARLPIVGVDSSIRLTTPDQDAVEQDVHNFLQLAHDWRSEFIRVFGGPFSAGHSPEQVFDTAAERLNRLAPAAERLGVVIVLETHDAFSSAANVAQVLRRVSSRSIGALWDTHHPHRVGETPPQILDLLGDRLLHVQVKDARRREAGGDAWDLVLLGEGEVPVAETVKLLRQRGYARWLAVEWEKKWHPEIAEPAVALPQHLALLRRWLA
jgi:sugar phosphate isomerase/epimerase